MTKYTYKQDYNNPTLIAELKKYAGSGVTKAECSSDCMMIIEADNSIKEDLDEFMNQKGFSYLFETEKIISNTQSWGILATADLPTTDVDIGDHVYDSTIKKPLWWNGTAWVDALGN